MTRPQPASVDLLMELAAELGDVLEAQPKEPAGPRPLTRAEQRRVERQNQASQEFAESLRAHIEPLWEAGYSYPRIALALNEAGVRNRQGGPWHPEALRRVVIPRLGLVR